MAAGRLSSLPAHAKQDGRESAPVVCHCEVVSRGPLRSYSRCTRWGITGLHRWPPGVTAGAGPLSLARCGRRGDGAAFRVARCATACIGCGRGLQRGGGGVPRWEPGCSAGRILASGEVDGEGVSA
eukprot:scaffold2313_cov202-Prasinococcus_capsulatus_cf.AAC.5